MAFDYKKEYKELYMPKGKPAIVEIPPMNYAAVCGRGDPNEADGEYQKAVSALYAVSYTLKMSYRTDHRIEGFFEYVVPPLEGFWKQEGFSGMDYNHKEALCWTAVIRLPDFITEEDLIWAAERVSGKKKIECSSVKFLTVDEGLCVQAMHVGPFDKEPETVARLEAYLKEQGYVNDLGDKRLHHEIYLSDVRKVAPEKWKTVIRHPIRRALAG